LDPLNKYRRSLRLELGSPRSDAEFQAARPGNPTLEKYPSIGAVLDAMGDESPDTYDRREALTRALVAEHQAGTGTLWSSILLVAYYPMLSRLRYTTYSDLVCRDDLDQLVLTSFVEVLGEFPLTELLNRTAMHLRQMTRRRVFKALRLTQKERSDLLELEELAEELGGLNPFAEARIGESRMETDEMIARLRWIVGDAVSERYMDLVIATVVRGEKLHDYVFRTCNFSNKQAYTRCYERMKRRRSRALETVRTALIEHYGCPHFGRRLLCLDDEDDVEDEVPVPAESQKPKKRGKRSRQLAIEEVC